MFGGTYIIPYLEDFCLCFSTFSAIFCLVSDCYYLGLGAEKDLDKAAEWYQKALDAGYEPDEEDQKHIAEVLGKKD